MKKISLKKKRQQNISHNYATGLAITIVMFVLILIGMLWTPYDPDAMQGSLKLRDRAVTLVRDRSIWKRCVEPCLKRGRKYII